jgi:DNA-binding GntR family transcriptional regulator
MLEAIAAEPRIAELLELEPGAPVAYIESVAWDADLRPFDCYRAWLRTDRTRIDIQASGPAAAESQPLAARGEEAM